MKKWLFAFVVILLGTFASMASEIDGKWKASIEGPNGSMELVFTFKIEGDKLTGAVSTPMGEMPISDGKFDGKEISFNIDMNGNPMPHKGTLEGDVIKMKVVVSPDGEGPREITLKKVVE